MGEIPKNRLHGAASQRRDDHGNRGEGRALIGADWQFRKYREGDLSKPIFVPGRWNRTVDISAHLAPAPGTGW
jgi:hypothetical protein